MNKPNFSFWFYFLHAFLLSNAVPIFNVAALIAYFCTPSYNFGIIIGFYFFTVFFWPATKYVDEIGVHLAHPNQRKKYMSFLEILQRIAVSTSFMCSVVFSTSWVQGRISFDANIANSVAYYFPLTATFLKNLSSYNELYVEESNAQNVVRIVQMTFLYGILYIVHFVGLGKLPEYLKIWFEKVYESALELWRQEQTRINAQKEAQKED